MVRYLRGQTRDSVFRRRRRVPKDRVVAVGEEFWFVSLRTKEAAGALEAHRGVRLEIEDVLSGLEGANAAALEATGRLRVLKAAGVIRRSASSAPSIVEDIGFALRNRAAAAAEISAARGDRRSIRLSELPDDVKTLLRAAQGAWKP